MSKIKDLFPQSLKNYLKHLPVAFLANLYYRSPARKLKVIGVTGTEGKTTTVNLISHILKETGFSVASISTVSARIGEEEIDTGLHVTSPDPCFGQKLLRKMVDRKTEYAVLEVTSIALDQFRFWGVDFEVAVLTNITRDHFDYHGTFEKYRLTKLKLFQNSKIAILNADDPSFDFISRRLKNRKIYSYGIKNKADFNPEKFKFRTKLPGEYNQYNCLAAIAAVSSLGIKREPIAEAVAGFEGVAGRQEEIKEGQNFKVFVDFAHTPKALEQVLKTLKDSLTKGRRLIAVFGSAGHRDKEKRPLMGKTAAKLADFVILTADDPRTEKVADICAQIAEGCRQVGLKPVIIEDRKKAIEYAFSQAKAGDIVVLCGKGHEKSLTVGREEIPWSDQKIARELLKKTLLKNQ